jgi:hypothetical protein
MDRIDSGSTDYHQSFDLIRSSVPEIASTFDGRVKYFFTFVPAFLKDEAVSGCVFAGFQAQRAASNALGRPMACRTFFGALCAATIASLHAAQAATFTGKQKAELLAAHNRYREEVGEPALAWSDRLADSALAWAQHLAHEVHALKHSGAVATGENIATWSAGYASLTMFVGLWGAERKFFIDASFPDVSRTGDWKAVAHYSQLVWRRTTKVGCGLATGGGQDYLVCPYNPQGNFVGEKAF